MVFQFCLNIPSHESPFWICESHSQKSRRLWDSLGVPMGFLHSHICQAEGKESSTFCENNFICTSALGNESHLVLIIRTLGSDCLSLAGPCHPPGPGGAGCIACLTVILRWCCRDSRVQGRHSKLLEWVPKLLLFSSSLPWVLFFCGSVTTGLPWIEWIWKVPRPGNDCIQMNGPSPHSPLTSQLCPG